MSFTPQDLDDMQAQAREHRAGRKVLLQVLSGVTGGTRNQFTEEITGETDVWVQVSGVVTLQEQNQELYPVGLGGKMMPRLWRVSFDYEDIIGLTHVKKTIIQGRTYNVERVEEDYFGPRILHVDFILAEGS